MKYERRRIKDWVGSTVRLDMGRIYLFCFWKRGFHYRGNIKQASKRGKKGRVALPP